jgi:hypothetical protein
MTVEMFGGGVSFLSIEALIDVREHKIGILVGLGA